MHSPFSSLLPDPRNENYTSCQIPGIFSQSGNLQLLIRQDSKQKWKRGLCRIANDWAVLCLKNILIFPCEWVPIRKKKKKSKYERRASSTSDFLQFFFSLPMIRLWGKHIQCNTTYTCSYHFMNLQFRLKGQLSVHFSSFSTVNVYLSAAFPGPFWVQVFRDLNLRIELNLWFLWHLVAIQ